MNDLFAITCLALFAVVSTLHTFAERSCEGDFVSFFGEMIPVHCGNEVCGVCPKFDHTGKFLCIEQDIKGNDLFSRKTLLYSCKDRTLKQVIFLSHRFPMQMRVSEKRRYYLRLQMSLSSNNSKIGDYYSYSSDKDGASAKIVGNGIVLDCQFREDGDGQHLIVRMELKPGWREQIPPPPANYFPAGIFGVEITRLTHSRTKLVESSVISSRVQDGKLNKRIIPCWKFNQPELLNHKYFDEVNCTFAFEDMRLVSVRFTRNFNLGDEAEYTRVKEAILKEAERDFAFSLKRSILRDGREVYSGSRNDGVCMCISTEKGDDGRKILSVDMELPWIK